MDDGEPVALVECSVCGWWCFFWEDRPTLPLVCDYCKLGLQPWEERRTTPFYGTPRARQATIPLGLEEDEAPTVIVVREELLDPDIPIIFEEEEQRTPTVTVPGPSVSKKKRKRKR